MTASTSERVLGALFVALKAAAPSGATVLRNAALPERIPAAGLMIVRDGDPGDPEVTLSPARWHYEHRAAVDIVVERTDDAQRDALFDALRRSIAAALAVDRTLGGLCDHAEPVAVAPTEIPVEGAATLKAASVGVTLVYSTSDPLL